MPARPDRGANVVAMKRRQRDRPIHVPHFGARLREMRGRQNRTEVCRAIRDEFGFALDASTLFHYERGTVKAPDPAMLYALAHYYDVDDLRALIELLVKERLGRPVRRVFVSFSSRDYTRAQRRIADLFGEMGEQAQQAVLFVMTKIHAAYAPPPPPTPVRRRGRR